MVTPKVIIRGRIERGEFQEPFRQCTEMLRHIGTLYHVNPAIMDKLVDFVLFFQSYPHEFAQTDLLKLRRENPFAPFLFVLGVCCEGMLRTTRPFDSPFYCYVHGWNNKGPEQIRRFLTDQPSIFALPPTTENDETAQWLNPVDIDHKIEKLSKKCLILTQFGPFGNDSAMNKLLADEQGRLGYEPIFSAKILPNSFTGKILADTDDSPPKKILESIQRLRCQFADNDFAVYVNSPRIDEKNDYICAGVTQILPKMRWF